MSAKSIFIIILSVLLTIILMKNTDDVNFWMFGDMQAPKLAVLAGVYAVGLITGLLLGRKRKPRIVVTEHGTPTQAPAASDEPYLKKQDGLSDDDRNYIS